jgi:hypothetical protein
MHDAKQTKRHHTGNRCQASATAPSFPWTYESVRYGRMVPKANQSREGFSALSAAPSGLYVYMTISDHESPAVTQHTTPATTVRPNIPADPPTPIPTPDPNAPIPARPAADLLVALGEAVAVPVGDAEVALSVLVLIPCTLQSVNGHEALVISDREE